MTPQLKREITLFRARCFPVSLPGWETSCQAGRMLLSYPHVALPGISRKPRMPGPEIKVAQRQFKQFFLIKSEGVRCALNAVQLLGLLRGRKQGASLIGQHLRVRCALDQKHGPRRDAGYVPHRVVAAQVGEKCLLQIKLLPVVPAGNFAVPPGRQEGLVAEE